MSADHMTRASLLFNSSLQQISEILCRRVKYQLLGDFGEVSSSESLRIAELCFATRFA